MSTSSVYVSVAQYWQRNESLWPHIPYTGECLTELTRKCRNRPTITRNVKLPLQTVLTVMIFLYLSKILRASIFFCLADWNISIILGNEPLSIVRRNLTAGTAFILFSIEKKTKLTKPREKVILNNNLQIITLIGISCVHALSKVLLGWLPKVKK